MRAFRLIPVMMALGFGEAAGQTAPVDQGVFSISRGGAAYGTESFLIIRQPSVEGGSYTLSSTRVVGGRTIRTSLTTDSMGAPITYMRQEVGGSPLTLVASGKSAGRLTVSFSEGDDRSSKDYLVAPGTLLLEDDLMHQLYFVGLSDLPRSIPYVAPASKTASSASLSLVDDGEVELGNKARIAARHFALGSGAAKRDFWIDSSGRLLRVSIPGQQIEAIRAEPPR
jgi:hypothetical protein